MRFVLAMPTAALALAAFAAPALSQVYVTSISASFPDSAGKVPAFNAVPGAAIPTWSTGLAQGVLTHGQSYNYCVSIASATASGKGQVSFTLKRGAAVILSDIIIKKPNYSIGSNGVWYFCSGYLATPNSPGEATLTGTVSYLPSGGTKSIVSKTAVKVVLQ